MERIFAVNVTGTSVSKHALRCFAVKAAGVPR